MIYRVYSLKEEKADPPTPITWYPDELAWQINLTKKFIRKSSCMEKFHNFLVHETETILLLIQVVFVHVYLKLPSFLEESSYFICSV
ncbi:tRNA (cytosine(34)-C(5))-methyltransferase [Desmophyllum pertusum]|uniref:tRNA (Cytosine(34)-C(5))-methyltransferase n=1 Tax=Desmophyllum pertusum TaxID=174260 RepID=A0A9X0CZM8_9CNID|nr:tRNA (cytosine(34)-C(5))-methyltransferase [Desmophyllum pertusum]